MCGTTFFSNTQLKRDILEINHLLVTYESAFLRNSNLKTHVLIHLKEILMKCVNLPFQGIHF